MTRKAGKVANLIGAAVVLLFIVQSSLAQAGPTISGTVADPSGAVIAGAAVTLSNVGTGSKATTMTGPDGSFSFPHPANGRYELKVRAAGFQPYAKLGLESDGSHSVRIDVQVELEGATQTVTVMESGLQIKRSDTEIGATLGGAKITAVPLNGRSFTDLLALQPAVIPLSSQQPNAVVMSGCTTVDPSGDANPGNMSVSGQRETSNGFVINGSSSEEGFSLGTAILPNLDSIAEFRVLTSNSDAEYGNYSGGQILLTTKSGTNQLHGSAFDFLRATGLDARDYFSAERAQYDRNQWGGTAGGPLRKNRAYFFADYQGTRMTEGLETGLISVPSAQDRAGDLSDVAQSLSGVVNGQFWANQLSQKLGYPVSVGEHYYLAGCSTSAQCVLPNAQIPRQAWSAPSQALLSYIPEPNHAEGTFDTSAYSEALRDDKGALRIDANTAWGAIAGYYFLDDYSLNNPYPTGQGGANVPGFNAISHGRAQLLTASLTRAFGSSAVNELHLSYLRDANTVGQPVGGVGPSLVAQGFAAADGTPGIVPLAPKIEGIENTSFNDFALGVDITGLTQANNTFQFADNFSKVMGKHTLKFGGGFHFDQININPDATFNGSFGFQGTETGSGFADFLLGVASSYAQGDSLAFYLRNAYAGTFAQDSWRLRPNLTLNYGLRWDMLPPWREKYNQLQTLVLGEQSEVYPGAPQGLVFPGDPGIPSTLSPTQYTSLAPRLGLAYSPTLSEGPFHKLFGDTGQSSVRLGFGQFYTAFEGLSAGIMSANPPYGYDYTSLAPPLFATPFVTAASGQNVGQRFPEPIPAFGASLGHPNSSIDWSQYLPITGVPSFFHENVPPYSNNYSLSFEREVAADTVLSVGYVGAQAHHLLALISANPGNPALCASLSQPSEVMPGTPTCGPFGESGTYTLPSGQIISGTRGPFSSQFAAVTYQKTIGNSNYNALEVSLRHQRGPLEVFAAYTYSKSLDQSSSLAEAINPIDAGLSKALSAFDMRQNFVVSYQYGLPLGLWFHHASRWTGGWVVSGITRFSTGLPVTLYNNNDTSLLGSIPNGINNNGVDTPDYRRGPLNVNTNPRNGQSAFATALFSLPALGEIGTAARRFFYGPGISNFDLALQKSLKLKETRFLDFRLEAFNTFNHAQFYGPASVDGNISSPSFGQFVSAAPPRILQASFKFRF